MDKRTTAAWSLAGAVMMAALTGCSSTAPANSLPDGQYHGQSPAQSDGSYGVIDFTVTGGQIVDAQFRSFDKDGTVHDENYGLGSDGQPVDKIFYQRAQNAIAAEEQFTDQFLAVGDQNKLDTIAGASISYRMFTGAIDDAVENHSH